MDTEPDSLDRGITQEGRQRRFRMVPVRYLLPNMITLLALCSGVTAIRLAVEGRYELGVACVMLAVVLDAVDGRLARLLKGTSRFGAELDSLADFVNFGVAPAILLYTWSLNGLRTAGWVIALMLAICCALRAGAFQCCAGRSQQTRLVQSVFYRRSRTCRGRARPAAALFGLPWRH